MSGWEGWVIAISIGIVALVFVLLVIFLVITLISLRRTLKTVNSICMDLEEKVHAFDPLFNVVSGVGQAVEKTSCMQQLSEEVNRSSNRVKKQKSEGVLNTTLEVVEWGLIGLALWQEIKDRR